MGSRARRAHAPRALVPVLSRPDLVQRAFTATAPDQLWVADITHCRTFAGWVYTALVVDVFSRRVVGWQLSKSLRTCRRPRSASASTSETCRPTPSTPPGPGRPSRWARGPGHARIATPRE